MGTCGSATGMTVALLSGTGRMGVHMAAAWANAGVSVMMCSRDKPKAQRIVDSLLSGKGYMEGQIVVPPTDATGWNLRASSVEECAAADVIALTSVYEAQWSQIERIADAIRGKGKIFIDCTNPFIYRGDGFGEGIYPTSLPQAAVLVHKEKLNDPTAKWAMSYRHVFWFLIHPEGPSPQATAKGVEVLGDDEAVAVTADLLRAHGWEPVLRGGLENAVDHEIEFGPGGSRRVQSKAKFPPPPRVGEAALTGEM